MASLTLSAETTVAALKSEFNAAFGATLRVYNGGRVADDSVTLGELGLSADGPFECRSSLTVDSFIERMKSEHNLKVKVYTCDGWVAVLGGLTLESAGKVKKNAVKTDMESMIAYQRTDKSPSDEYSVIKNEDGSYTVSINGVVQDNAKAAMRQIAEAIGFDYDPDWTTRQFGSKLAAALGCDDLSAPVSSAEAAPAHAAKPKAEAPKVEKKDDEPQVEEFAENSEDNGWLYSVYDGKACLDGIIDNNIGSKLIIPDYIIDDNGRKYPVKDVSLAEANFEEIVFPKELDMIYGYAFSEWDGNAIPKIVFKNERIVFEDGVFYNKEKTILFNAVFASISKEYAVKEGVREVYEGAFGSHDSLERLIFPSSIREINCGFEELNNLKEVVIYAKESDVIFYDELGETTNSSDIFPNKTIVKYETKSGIEDIKRLFTLLKKQDVYDSGFSVDKKTINKVFETTNPHTKEGVLARLTIIDSLYSTQMGKRYYGLDELAEVLSSFDNLQSLTRRFLSDNDTSVFDVEVKQGGFLASIIKSKRTVSLFDEKYGIDKNGNDSGVAISLITKYLYFLTNGEFPIYDSIAVSILPKLWEYCGFDVREMPSLKTNLAPGDKNYGNEIITKFVIALDKFLNKLGYGGEHQKYDYLDRIMWFTGKICRGNLSLILSREQYEALAKQTKAEIGSDSFSFNIETADISKLDFLGDNSILKEFFLLAKEIGPLS